tara:strand:- start:263 stop:859 length:597 start_codon:yes stop_codon:yes gene_type:complete
MGAIGVPMLGEGVLSTWEITVDEIVSSGTDRIIVYEGAEEKLKQLNSGVLEKLGVGGSSWEDRERDRYRVNLVPVENQLGSGENIEESQRMIESSTQEVFQEDQEEFEYVELEDRRNNKSQKLLYLDDPPNEVNLRAEDEKKDLQLIDNNTSLEEGFIFSEDSPKRIKKNTLEEPLDVEPIPKNTKEKNKLNEIDDPW